MSIDERKRTQTLTFRRPDGTPVRGAEVKVDQTAHRFLFGCGAFDALRLMQTRDEKEKAHLEARMEKWLRLFNYGTLPFYWGQYEPVEGSTLAEPMQKAARWLKQRGVTLKGHPLCWHTVCAPWLLNYDNEEILRRQIDRIHREVSAFKGLIDMWDVINEVVIMPEFDRYDNAVTRLCRAHGRVELVKKVFEAAREENPRAMLLINDFNTSPAYANLLEELLSAGVTINAIGIQSHQHQGYWGLDKLHAVLERFEAFRLPIHFTENTLVSGDIMPSHIVDLNDYQVPSWPSTPQGEDRQAREAVEMYTALFEHPLVEAITTWDSVDGCWLGAPSGVMRADNTEKPVYHALFEKIHGDWETHTTLTTDETGSARLTGFAGQYDAVLQGKRVSFPLNGRDGIITVE